MDTHTRELLEFDKVRQLVASYAACSLGKGEAARMGPSTDPGWIRQAQALTTEMTEALGRGVVRFEGTGAAVLGKVTLAEVLRRGLA